jgi:flagellar FliL protein
MADENQEIKPEGDSRKPEKGVSKILIIISFMSLMLCGGGGYYFLVFKPETPQEEKQEDKRQNAMEIGYMNLPDIIINLKSTKNKTSVLKASFVLELESLKDKEALDQLKPVIIDEFQTYLRELEISDIQGSAGLERVRQELFNRVSSVISPLKVRKVLIKEFLTQ